MYAYLNIFKLSGPCVECRSENSDRELQITESSVRSYFVQQDGKWECQLPTDPSSRDSYRLPIGFVTTGFVQGRSVIYYS